MSKKILIDPNKVYILSCKRDSILGKIISRITGLSHSAYMYMESGTLMITDSRQKGTHTVTYENWLARRKYKFQVIEVPQIGKHNKEQFLKILKRYLGLPYPWWELLIQLLYIYTRIWIKTKSEKKLPICSELIMVVLKEMNIYKGDQHHRMNPKDVHRWAINNLKNFKK